MLLIGPDYIFLTSSKIQILVLYPSNKRPTPYSLQVEDEILAVNLVDVRHVSLDDVVIIMSIPRRLVLTIRSRISGRMPAALSGRPAMDEVRPPVVVVKKEFVEEAGDDYPANDWMRGAAGRTQVRMESHHQMANQRQQPDVSDC